MGFEKTDGEKQTMMTNSDHIEDSPLVIHVMPANDMKPHEQSVNCHCNPRIESEDEDGEPLDGIVCVHNAFDRRELREQRREALAATYKNKRKWQRRR